jgi:hypothetical protein
MDVEQLELNAPLRIKFASMDKNENLIGDAGPEYNMLFPNLSTLLESGWIATGSQKIHTRTESYNHRTWILSHENLRIVAVEHETGIEFLIDTFKDVSVQVATAAVTSLISFLWTKWRAARKSRGTNFVESTYVKETLKISPDGSKTYTRELLPGTVSNKGIEENMANALAELSNFESD